MTKKHWSEVLACSCGARFRSVGAEAFHRHNFPLLCRPKKVPAAVRVLRRMVELQEKDEDGTLTQEGIYVYIDGGEPGERTTGAVVKQLINWCAIKPSYQSKGYTVWDLNETGRAIARRPELGDEIYLQIMKGKGSFTIKNDRIEKI